LYVIVCLILKTNNRENHEFVGEIMVTTTNPITGDAILSRKNNKQYEDNYDLIWGKKNKDPICDVCGKSLASTKECGWTGCPLNWDEGRIDINGGELP
jgi:hypothetical protein